MWATSPEDPSLTIRPLGAKEALPALHTAPPNRESMVFPIRAGGRLRGAIGISGEYLDRGHYRGVVDVFNDDPDKTTVKVDVAARLAGSSREMSKSVTVPPGTEKAFVITYKGPSIMDTPIAFSRIFSDGGEGPIGIEQSSGDWRQFNRYVVASLPDNYTPSHTSSDKSPSPNIRTLTKACREANKTKH